MFGIGAAQVEPGAHTIDPSPPLPQPAHAAPPEKPVTTAPADAALARVIEEVTNGLAALLTKALTELARTVAEQKAAEQAVREKYERLAEQSEALAGRCDALLRQVGLQQEEISALRSAAADISPKVATILERLDRQAEAIRSIYEAESTRAAAFDELAGVVGRLKASSVAHALTDLAKL